MLAALDPPSIARMRFPLGELTKPQVRELAEREGLAVARKPDSQDLCFLAGHRPRGVPRAATAASPSAPARVLDVAGRTIGRHRGAHGYTVGQRRGLGVGGRGEPLYVTATDVAANTVTAGRGAQLRTTPRAARRTCGCTCRPSEVARVKLRYRAEPVACELRGERARARRARLGRRARPDRGAAAGRVDRRLCDDRPMSRSTDEIRETFLEFFASRGHLRIPSASLVPATFDASVLLTTAGMHPLKGYFLGIDKPPATLLTSCQKCFRTTDIENVGNTSRHLTFFEMLGNFSIGEYFKQGAAEFAWELSLEGFGFNADDIWITVFEGDDELGLGPDEEAIGAWESIGIPRERIVLLPARGELLAVRSDRPVRPVQRALPGPRPRVRQAPTTCPAATTSASSSTGTSSSCSTTRTRPAS